MSQINTATSKVKKPVAKKQSMVKTESKQMVVKKQQKKATTVRSESEYLELKGFLSFLILHEVGQKKLCGEDLAKKIGRRKGGMLTPGTIYPALKKLRKKKLVKYKRFGRKKIYELTETGKEELRVLYKLFSNYFYGLKHIIRREHYKV